MASAASATPSPTTKLTYWNGRGKAEVIRFVLGYCLENDAWEDVYMTVPEDLAKLRASGVLMYHQVPYLTMNGKHYVQTSAILSMLGRKFNLYGANADESDMVDMVVQGCNDAKGPFVGLAFQPDRHAAMVKTAEEHMPLWLPKFEKVCEKNTAGRVGGKCTHVVGNSMTIADLALLEVLIYCEEVGTELGDAGMMFKGCPRLVELLESLRKDSRVARFLAGPHHHPIADMVYVNAVDTTLGRPLRRNVAASASKRKLLGASVAAFAALAAAVLVYGK